MLIKRLLDKLDKYNINEQVDTLANFNLTLTVDSLPDKNIFYEIKDLLSEYPKRDLVNICIQATDDDFFNLIRKEGTTSISGPEHINASNLDVTWENFKKFNVVENPINVRVKIEKDYKSGLISIYSLDSFVKWITDKSIYEMITFFSEIYKNRDQLAFISYDGDIEVITETFQIVEKNRFIERYPIDREQILDARLEITNIQGIGLSLIPEDFNIIKYNFKSCELRDILDVIKDLLSIIYIADISIIEHDLCKFRINGYRSSEFSITYNEIFRNNKNNHLYEIYKWIYNDGNLIDKSTIARNIISLHCRYKSILDIDTESLSSIKENYAYYLKTNTDDYLEEKKNIRLSIIEEGKVLSEALYELIGNMGKNLLAYFTFLATLIVSNTLANGTFSDIFTFEIVQIVASLILGSFLFLIFSNIEANYKRKRVKDYLEDLKVGYGVMLGDKNVEEIIESVMSYKRVRDNFIKRQIFITVLWALFNLILFLILDWVSKDTMIFGFINIL